MEYLREQIDALEQELESTKEALRTTKILSMIALRENQQHREEKLGIVQPLDVGAMLRDSAPRIL